jgi:hypothetical protein
MKRLPTLITEHAFVDMQQRVVGSGYPPGAVRVNKA